ncbi:MAG TPA: helix-turn-helix transcriptional regulator [Acidimicrobiales bacterium]|nr:helix-turn-helix transcriptional regulator [Acidimicrobiales bacterium]
MTAADVIREVRHHACASQRDLALLAGVPQSTISRIETGRMQPTFEALNRLVTAAGCRLHIKVECVRPMMGLYPRAWVGHRPDADEGFGPW